MFRLKGSSFFCEDVRIEASGQPMFIGVMDPTLEVFNLPDKIKSLIFVSMFYANNTHQDISLSLEISVSGCDEDNSHLIGSFERPLADNFTLGDEDSLIFISRNLDGIKVCDGTRIDAKVRYADVQEEYSLKFVQMED